MSLLLFCCFTGFVTPQNKNVLSRKALFSDKPKMALGDLKKNSFNVVTPLKSCTIEKTKQETRFQLSTPTFKPRKFNDAGISTAKPQRNVIDYTKDELDVWNQKLVLSDDQFDLLFINPPNIDMAPPSPCPMPEPECPEYFPTNFDFESVWDFIPKTQDDEYELPPLNMDIFSDNLCGSPLKERDVNNAVNRISSF